MLFIKLDQSEIKSENAHIYDSIQYPNKKMHEGILIKIVKRYAEEFTSSLT